MVNRLRRASSDWFVTAGILVQAIVLGAVLSATGRFAPIVTNDTASYASFPLDSLPAALNQIRTPGFPLFLRTARFLSVGEPANKRANGPRIDPSAYRAVPVCQYGIHLLAVLVFATGLGRITASRLTQLLASSSLLYSNTLVRHVADLTADAIASSLAILSIGMLFLLVTSRRSASPRPAPGVNRRAAERRGHGPGILVTLGLACAVFLAYWCRPAYLFLVVLVPILGTMLLRLVTTRRRFRRRLAACAAPLVAASIGPLVAYCLVRWLVVGQFALVSFGGYNLVALSGQFLADDDVPRLPEHLRPLAAAALERRRELTATDPLWASGDAGSYLVMESRYDSTMWEIFVPTARQLYDHDPRRINENLRELASATIRLRPRAYASWLLKAFRRGVGMVGLEFMGHPMNVAALAAMVLFELTRMWVRSRGRRSAGAGLHARAAVHRGMSALLLVAVSYGLLKLLLVIAVAPALGRFTDAAAVFLPCVAMAGVADRWQALCRRTVSAAPPR